jgi:hypothetical protein
LTLLPQDIGDVNLGHGLPPVPINRPEYRQSYGTTPAGGGRSPARCASPVPVLKNYAALVPSIARGGTNR